MKQIEERQQRLMDAIETGALDLDETTLSRAHLLKVSEEAIIIDLAATRRAQAIPTKPLRTSQIDKLGKLQKDKMLAKVTDIAKNYLNLLIDEIVVTENTAQVKGSYAALMATVNDKEIKKGNLKLVPSFIHDWCPRHESNV